MSRKTESLTRLVRSIASLRPVVILRWRKPATPVVARAEEPQLPDLPCDGHEVFTETTLPDRVYRIQITGSFSYVFERTIERDIFGQYKKTKKTHEEYAGAADAFYYLGAYGNFTERYPGLLLDGKPLGDWPHHVIEEDRHVHDYVVHVDGTGRRLSLALRPPRPLSTRGMGGPELISLRQSAEKLTVRVDLLPEGTLSPQIGVQELEADGRLTTTRTKAMVVAVGSQILRNWSDPAFQADVAQTHTHQLLNRREEIGRGLVKLFTEDADVAEYLEKNHPEVVPRLTGSLEAFLAAERLEAKPRTTPPPPLPKRKLTAAQVRSLIVGRERVAADDEHALIQQAVEAWERKAELLRSKGLEEGEIDQAIGTVTEAIEAARGRIFERKEGQNATIKKLE